MATRRDRPKKIPYSVEQLQNGLPSGAPTDEQSLRDYYEKLDKRADAILKKWEPYIKAQEKQAAAAEESMDDLFDHIEKNAKKAAESTENSFNKMFEGVRISSENIKKNVDKHFEKPRTVHVKAKVVAEHVSRGADPLAGSGWASLAEAFHAKAIGHGMFEALTESLRDVSHELIKMAPEIAAISSVAAVVTAIVDKVIHLDQVRGELMRHFGGNMEAVEGFMQRIGEVSRGTILDENEVLALGKAFQQAGIPIVGDTKHLTEYMVVAGNVNRIIGTSVSELAEYTNSYRAHGDTVEQVHGVFDDFYQLTQKYQLTLEDLNTSMRQGDDLWMEFGAISGKTLDQMQRDILDVKADFRAFNIDVKNTGTLLGGIFGDTKMQTRQASLISSMTGMSGPEAFNELVANPQAAMGDLMRSGIKFLQSVPNTHFGMSDQDLKSKFGDEEIMGIYRNRKRQISQLTTQFGLPKEFVGQMVNDYSGFVQSTGLHDVDAWRTKRLVGATLPGAMGSLDTATNAYNNTIGQTLKHTNNTIDEILNRVGMVIIDVLPPLLDGVNNLVNMFSGWAETIHLPWERSHFADKYIVPGSTTGTPVGVASLTNAAPVAQGPIDFSPMGAPATAGAGGRKPGWISSKYESGGRAGAVNMDPNRSSGWDYGHLQFNQAAGIPQKYIEWARENDPSVFSWLSPFVNQVGMGNRGEFGRRWAQMGKEHPAEFKESQRLFAMEHYLKPLTDSSARLRSSPVLQEDAFATAIQFGTGTASKLMQRAGLGNKNVSNEQFIRNLANVKAKAYPPNAGRYYREADDELAELLKEQNAYLKEQNASLKTLVQVGKKSQQTQERQLLKGDGGDFHSKMLHGNVG